MSLTAALSNSLSSLQVIQKSIATISNNISNANTDGYSRKSAVQQSVLLGSDFGGVTISGYSRVTNDAVLRSWLDTLSDSGFKGAQSGYLQQVGQLFGTNIDNPQLSELIEDFASAWRLMEAAPEDSAAQRQVVAAGTALANEIRRLSAGVEEFDRNIKSDLKDSTVDLNAALNNIQTLNNQISVALARGQPIGDYQDQRDQEVRKIAAMIDIKVYDRSSGQIALYTPSGYSLIDGDPRQFEWNGSEIVLEGSSTVVTNYLSGGKIEGLYKLQYDGSPSAASGVTGEEVIRKLRDQLDTLAEAFLDTATSGTFGYVYNNATATTGELNTNFFTGTDRTDIAIASALTAGTSTVKKAAATDIVDAMNDSTRSFTMDGLSVNNVSYTTLVSNIVATVQQTGSTLRFAADTAAGQEAFYEERFQGSVGVNVDDELVQLQILQNSYQASARLISVINDLYEILNNISR